MKQTTKTNKPAKAEKPAVEKEEVVDVQETAAPVVDEAKFKENFRVNEEFATKKRDIRAKMKEAGKDKDLKKKLQDELAATMAEEKAWLKSVAEKLTEITKGNDIYKCTKRGENALLFEIWSSGFYGNDKPTLRGYEVIRRDFKRPQIFRGKPYDAAEMFPGDNSFSYWHYRFTPLADALAKAEAQFNRLESGAEVEEESSGEDVAA